MDDPALIERAKSDKEAFGQLYEQYVDRIYNYIYYRTGNHADAEDLTARVFFRAMQHIERFEDQGVPFSAWLYRIAHNLVANWHRDNSRRTLISLEDLINWRFPQDGPEQLTVSTDDQAALLDAIQRLPADRQDLLILKYVEQLSNAEIGEILGRSEGAVKSLYHRTLLTLRDDIHTPAEQQLPGRSRWRRLLPG
jgi:RNA polymerase sigma-70 factor (ECF subfamily)